MNTLKIIKTLLLILISFAAFTGLSYAQDAEGSQGNAGPTDVWVGQVNINEANVEEIQQVPWIDKELSANIVEFRQANGPFSSTDELLKVKGIDENKLTFIKGHVTLEGETTLEHIYP